MTSLMRVPVPWMFVLMYLVGAAMERLLPIEVGSSVDHALPIAGAMLFVVGATLAGWGWTIFRRGRTTTVPGQRSTTLVTSGPYRFTRNPMYVGLSLAYLGEAGLQKQLWPVLLLPLVLVHLNGTVIPVEEARLKEVFRDEYERYTARVRRWI